MEQALYDQTLPPFDELVEMAENNPEGFNAFKRETCEQFITYASEEMQPRLRAQQSHIDRVIRRCKNPHHTNVVLARELSLQVHKMQNILEGDIETRPEADIICISSD